VTVYRSLAEIAVLADARLRKPPRSYPARTRTDFANILQDKELRRSVSQTGTESGTACAQSAPFDPDLQAVIDAWPSVPDKIQQSVLAMVRESVRE